MSAAEFLPWIVIILGTVLVVAQIALDFTIATRKGGSGLASLDPGAKEVLLKLADKSPLLVGGIVLLLFGALFTGQFSFSAGAI